MPTSMRLLLVLGLVALATTTLQAQQKYRSDLITDEEIARSVDKGATAFDAVQTLRPQWLRVRDAYLHGDGSDLMRSQGAHVYLNDHDQGDVEYLKTIPAELVAEIRWISATQAGARFGPTDGPGIVVTLKR